MREEIKNKKLGKASLKELAEALADKLLEDAGTFKKEVEINSQDRDGDIGDYTLIQEYNESIRQALRRGIVLLADEIYDEVGIDRGFYPLVVKQYSLGNDWAVAEEEQEILNEHKPHPCAFCGKPTYFYCSSNTQFGKRHVGDGLWVCAECAVSACKEMKE